MYYTQCAPRHELADGSIIMGPVTSRHMEAFLARDRRLAILNIATAEGKNWPVRDMDGFLHSAQTIAWALR